MKGVYLFIMFFFLSLLVISVEGKQQVELINADTGETLKEVIVHLDLVDDQHYSIRQVIYVKDMLIMPISAPHYTGSILIDDPETPAPDYYFSGALMFDTNQISITFIPIALVHGEVYDPSETLVSAADLSFRCDRMSTLPFPTQTDKYGSFVAYVPTGVCAMVSTKEGMTGQETLVAERGQSYDLVISLEQRLPQNRTWMIWLIGIVLVVAVWWITKKRQMPSKKKQKKSHEVSHEIRNILKTLDESEKKVMMLLLESKKTLSASHLRHQVKIPKTSFSRILERLERKQLIVIETEGAFKKVHIADWLKKR